MKKTRGKLVVYSLSDPDTGEVRYVGSTRGRLGSRLSGHVSHARTVAKSDDGVLSAKDTWIIELISAGKRPVVAELVSKAKYPSERSWVEKLHREGAKLLNINLVPRRPIRPTTDELLAEIGRLNEARSKWIFDPETGGKILDACICKMAKLAGIEVAS